MEKKTDTETKTARCLLWRELGPEKYDGDGLFKDDDDNYYVLSRTPGGEKKNPRNETEAKEYAAIYCSPAQVEKIFQGATMVIRYEAGIPIRFFKE